MGQNLENPNTILRDSAGNELATTAKPLNVIDPCPTATGSLTTAVAGVGNTVAIATQGCNSIGGTITGTWVGTIVPEGTIDGTNWFTCRTANKGTNDILNTYSANDSFEFYDVGGCIQVRLRMTAFTSGSATVFLAGTQLETKELLNYSGPDNDAGPPLRHLSIASLATDGTLRALRNTNVDPTGTEFSLIVRALMYALGTSSFSPDPTSIPSAPAQPYVDGSGRMEVHGTMTSDEGSFRDDFTGAALTTTLAGTLSLTNGSTAVVGTGTTFTTAVVVGQWLKQTTDSETLYAQVVSVDSDTGLTLTTAYAGVTTGAATCHVSNWKTVTATGGSITVATGLCALASGTTNGQFSTIQRLGDFLPYTFTSYASISQRIANQTAVLGFRDVWATPVKRAEVQFLGTTNTQVNFVTSFGTAASDIQTTTVTIPSPLGSTGPTTATQHQYKIDLSGNRAVLQIDGVVVATHDQHIPGPYDNLNIFAGIVNTGVPGSSTTLNVDSLYFYNTDRMQTDSDFQGEPQVVAGPTFPGVALTTNPFTMAGVDGGGLVRTLLTDTGGRPVNVGAGVAGATPVGNPLLVGGYDGTNTRIILTDSIGRLSIVQLDNSAAGALGALNATQTASTSGSAGFGFVLAAGTLIGTLIAEASWDSGATWQQVPMVDPFSRTPSMSLTFGVANTLTTRSIIVPGGAGQVRVRVSAYTSGTANCTLRGTSIVDVAQQQNVRTRVSIVYQAVATATADTLLSLVKSTAGVAAAGATTIPVTAGKTLRITSMTFSLKAGAATAAFATFTVRVNPSGAAVIGSQSEFRVDLGNTAAVVGAADKVTIPIPDGFELTGAAQLAISAAAQAVTNVLSVALNGYEY